MLDAEVEKLIAYTPPDRVRVPAAHETLTGGDTLPGFSCEVGEFFRPSIPLVRAGPGTAAAGGASGAGASRARADAQPPRARRREHAGALDDVVARARHAGGQSAARSPTQSRLVIVRHVTGIIHERGGTWAYLAECHALSMPAAQAP